MDYWKGMMNWPIDRGWSCIVCGNTPLEIDGIGLVDSGLTWGMVHGQCRCNRCHTIYKMRDDFGEVVTTPICLLKENYMEAAVNGWIKYRTPIDNWDDSMWNELGV